MHCGQQILVTEVRTYCIEYITRDGQSWTIMSLSGDINWREFKDPVKLTLLERIVYGVEDEQSKIRS
jgi:hypothetical protein